jgi:glycosyltransferase involved in cell wall biosynthesis
MSENPKLSIITVNLNNRDGLQRTIDSVVSQTFSDYEWIVIDGGSTDGSRELIEQYQDHFSYWCSEPDKGIYNAMNKGIAHAKGEWLQFLNSGDWLADKEILNFVFNKTPFDKDNNVDIVYGNIYQGKNSNFQPLVFNSYLNFSFLYFKAIPHQSSFIKRDLLYNRLYNEDLKILADWEFYIECALTKSVFLHIDDFISYYDTTGISSTNREALLYERALVIKKFVPEYIQRDMDELDLLQQTFADGQLLEINTIRNSSRFLHRIVTLTLYILRFFYKLTVRQ